MAPSPSARGGPGAARRAASDDGGFVWASDPPLLPLQGDVLVRRGVGMAGNEPEPGLPDTRAHSVEERELEDWSVHDARLDDLLHLLERRVAPLGVQLGGLLAEEAVEVWVAAVDVGAVGDHEGLEASGRIAKGAAGRLDDVLELLLRVGLEEGGTLQRHELDLDAYRLEVVHHDLGEVRVGGVAIEVACVEAVRVAGVAEELLGARDVEDRGRRLPEELEVVGDDAAGDLGMAERQGLVDRGAVDGEAGGESDALVVPRRLRIPLIGEIEPEGRLDDSRLEGEPRRPLQLFGELP